MGLIVLLIGFLALSAAGLIGLPGGETLAAQAPEGAAADSTAINTAYKPYVAATPAEAASIAAGDALFKNNCAQCHAVNDRVVGPALAGISKRRSTPWVIKWVKNSSKVIASGDEYAVKLFNDYGKQQMPSFPQFSDQDITDIVTWVKSQEMGDARNVAGAVAAN